jgi:hypothetical protein
MSAQSTDDRREPPDLDSTQTVRAISMPELYDSHRPKWFVIQLALSDKPVNLDMMPRLDVFAAHRLYVVAGKQEGATRYALRLGFFPDEQSAEAICGYLKTFFSSPSIVRVSAAEQARFAQPAAPRAAVPNPASSSTPAPRPSVASVPASAPAAAPAVPPQAVARKSVAANSAKTLPPSIKANGSQKMVKRTKTLAEALLEEAREVQRSRRGKNQVSEQSGSWLSRLFGAPKAKRSF